MTLASHGCPFVLERVRRLIALLCRRHHASSGSFGTDALGLVVVHRGVVWRLAGNPGFVLFFALGGPRSRL